MDSGDLVGGYRLEEAVGQGPTGVVFRASHPRLQRDVALKVVHDDVIAEPAYRERLEREIQLAVKLEHPCLVPILDFDEDRSRYVVSQFVRGRDLGRLLSRVGQLGPEQALSILTQVAAALEAAHAGGLVHGSVKPSNVMVAEAFSGRSAGSVLLTDLAVARGLPASRDEIAQGIRRPALEYVSPEQIEGDPATAASDQYALACLAYACLTGRPPFSRERDSGVLTAHILEAPPSARSLSEDLPAEADQILARALAKAPGERFSSCGELVEALSAAIVGATARAQQAGGQAAPVYESRVSGSLETEFRLGAAPAEASVRPGETELTPSRGRPAPAAPEAPSDARTPAVAPAAEVVAPPQAPPEPQPPPGVESEVTPAQDAEPPAPASEPTPVAPEQPNERSAQGPRRRSLRVPALLAAALLGALAIGGVAFAMRGGEKAEAALGPAPKPDSLELEGKQQYVVALSRLLRNDEGRGLEVVGVGGGARLRGQVRLRGSSLEFVPDGGYSGAARFTYTVEDRNGNFGVANVSVQVKGLSQAERDLVALVPKSARASCESVRPAKPSRTAVRCRTTLGDLVLRGFASAGAAGTAFGKEFRASAGDCRSAAATGRWVWPGDSDSRGRFGCAVRAKRAVFGWTYPTSRSPFALGVLTGKQGSQPKQLSEWFFGRARLPKPS